MQVTFRARWSGSPICTSISCTTQHEMSPGCQGNESKVLPPPFPVVNSGGYPPPPTTQSGWEFSVRSALAVIPGHRGVTKLHRWWATMWVIVPGDQLASRASASCSGVYKAYTSNGDCGLPNHNRWLGLKGRTPTLRLGKT